jgi:hypothetical protein
MFPRKVGLTPNYMSLQPRIECSYMFFPRDLLYTKYTVHLIMSRVLVTKDASSDRCVDLWDIH